MALFGKVFGSKKTKAPRGFHELVVKKVQKLNNEAVKVVLDIPSTLAANYKYIPGQYVDINVNVDGGTYRRSYSICSGPNEDLAIAIKKVDGGKVSNWANHDLTDNSIIQVSEPLGNFTLLKNAKKIIAIAAGSGITPILAIAKSLEKTDNTLSLFYGNRTPESSMFVDELSNLNNTLCTYFYSQSKVENSTHGRIDKEAFSTIIKSDIEQLKADCFLICGPEEMVFSIEEVLKTFGVQKDKIKYELFTTPVNQSKDGNSNMNTFEGLSKVTIILDDDKVNFELKAKGDNILDRTNKEGLDVPYSCKGGVCCTCKAKVLKGKAIMDMNYALTDKEVEEGYILTCQAHPASEELLISYDE